VEDVDSREGGTQYPGRSSEERLALFKVDTESRNAVEVLPTDFKSLKLWERKDLQEWVKSNSSLIEEEVLLLASEFDQFDKTNNRLDVLGVKKVEGEDGTPYGRLVVVELKRDSDKSHALQALQYAAYVSGFTDKEVVSLLAELEEIEEEDARKKLADFLGLDVAEEIEIDSRPMVVLLAQRFRDETTTTVMWLLEELKLDISCVRLVPYEIGGQLFVQTDKIIPLPEAEKYRMAKQNKEDSKKPGARKQGANVLNALIENDLLADGDELRFRQARIPMEVRAEWPPDRPGLTATLSTDGDTHNLVWTDPATGRSANYAISRLASMVLALVKGEDPNDVKSAGVQGVDYWEYEGKGLKALATAAGLTTGSAAKFNAEDVREVCKQIPKGRWTSYKAVAEALGSPNGAQSVSRILASSKDWDNPHRVLRKNGEIASNWGVSTSQDPEDCRSRLEQEGVEFNEEGRALMSLYWEPDLNPAAGQQPDVAQ